MKTFIKDVFKLLFVAIAYGFVALIMALALTGCASMDPDTKSFLQQVAVALASRPRVDMSNPANLPGYNANFVNSYQQQWNNNQQQWNNNEAQFNNDLMTQQQILRGFSK